MNEVLRFRLTRLQLLEAVVEYLLDRDLISQSEIGEYPNVTLEAQDEEVNVEIEPGWDDEASAW
jgi:hypothetical protein